MQVAESAGASQEVASATGPLPDLRPRAVRLLHESITFFKQHVGRGNDDAVDKFHAGDIGNTFDHYHHRRNVDDGRHREDDKGEPRTGIEN